MTTFDFQQVDVFSATPLKGNPVAVVLGADGLSDQQMAEFANWTNLSETTFLLAPTVPKADYRVRIFTPEQELPFAGHPTLGSCHAWVEGGGVAKSADMIVQECAAGLISIKRDGSRFAFAAPPLVRSGPLEDELVAKIAAGLGIAKDKILASQWTENGPPWANIMLASRAEVLALEPDWAALTGNVIGVVGAWDPEVDGTDAAFELRALIPSRMEEDPVTGSLNAGVAQWLIGAGLAPESYVASQGAAVGRQGRIYVEQANGEIWIGGETLTCISGQLTI